MNHVLSRLPWPLGQEVMALWGIARGVTSPVRRARAVQWAACHRTGSSARWRLALSLLANDGRFEAIHGLLGVRDAETLRATQIIEGEERLRSAVQAGGVILLGFHLGPNGAWLGLRLAGFAVRPMLHRVYPPNTALLPYVAETAQLPFRELDPKRVAIHLYHARALVRGGHAVFMPADGAGGAEAFRIPVQGATVIIKRGWLALRRSTGAPTLPVLIRRAGRRRVLTIHPALPAPHPDPERDVDACRDTLAPILADYVRRFPEQCRAVVMHGTGANTRVFQDRLASA